MIDLEPIALGGLDCILNSYVTILNHVLGEYQYCLWDSWMFQYINTEDDFGMSIKIPIRIYRKNMEKFYSLEKHPMVIKDFERFLEETKGHLEKGEFVIVTLDTYYCNWYEDFGKEHGEHSFIVMDYSDGVATITDTMPRRVGVKLEEERMRQGLLGALWISFEKRTESRSAEMFIEYTLQRKKEKEEMKQLEAFIQDYKQKNLSEIISFETHVWSVPFIRNIKRIADSRINFVSMLEYLQKEEDKDLVAYITKQMMPVTVGWTTAANLLHKMHISRNVSRREKLDRCFEQILIAEKEAFENIKVAFEKKEFVIDDSVRKEYSYLRIAYDECSHMVQDSNFIRETDIFDESTWLHKEFHLELLGRRGELENCYTAEGQRVLLSDFPVTAIHLIGYAIWENQFSECQLEYEDSTETKDVKMSDWCGGAQFGEKVLWKGTYRAVDTNMEHQGGIYDVRIPVDKSRKLVAFVLPNCDKIKLLATYVEKEEVYEK